MTDPTTCPECGAPLPPGADPSTCPRCLLGAGLPEDAEDTAPAAVAPLFPELEIEGVIGRGGMGVVYKARQKRLDRVVALKLLPAALQDEPGFAERFEREARTLARLDHPSIVRVHDSGEREGRYYFVMEFVDGPNLRRAIDTGALGPADALRIVPQICEALQYAHDRGVVHRDIKPENVLLDAQGQIKVTDFGLAKLLDHDPADASLTRSGQVMGTLRYMAPEQYRTPDDVDHRADIYSLGVVFYEMLTGEVPMGRFEPPSERVAVDVRIDDVVLRTLERERERRYQRAEEVRSEVATITSRATALPPPLPQPPVEALPEATSEAPRLNRAALFGFLCTPAALAVWIVAVLAGSLGPGGGVALVGVALAPILPIAGFITSIVGWIQISGSRGRQRGLGFAIVGTFAPFLLFVVGGAVSMLFFRVAEPMEPESLEDTSAHPLEPRLGADDETQTSELEATWRRFTEVLRSSPIRPTDLEPFVAEVDRRRVDLLDPADRSRLGGSGELGLAFLPPPVGGRALAGLDIQVVTKSVDQPNVAWLRLSAPGIAEAEPLEARVIRGAQGWTFALGRVAGANAHAQDRPQLLRSGRISPRERRTIDAEVEVLWRIVQGLWAAGPMPLRSRVPATTVDVLLAPSETDVRLLSSSERAERGQDGSLGLLFFDADTLSEPLAEFRLTTIRFQERRHVGRVTAQSGSATLTFFVIREGGRTWLSARPIQVDGR